MPDGNQPSVSVQPYPSDDEAMDRLWYDETSWNEASIPPRAWLAQGYLLRGSVTGVVGPGGVSKSSLMVAWAVHLALGLPCHQMQPLGSYRVMIYNVEDDQDEQRRRLSGVLTSLGRTPDDIAGKVARLGPSTVGTLIGTNENGVMISTKVMEELERRIEAFKPDILILDPLAELHNAEENDNTALRSVVATFRELARRHNAALVLLHHTRKGLVIPGDADAVRGASSIASAARVVLTTTGMTEDDEKAFGLQSGSRKHFFRVDGAKGNYAPLSDAEWFERASYTLDNGDTVAVCKPWHPPEDVCTPEIRIAVEAGIARGHASGPWSPQLGNSERSVKNLMVECGITTKPGQMDLLTALLKAGYVKGEYKTADRKWAKGLRTPDGKPSNVEWNSEGDVAAPGQLQDISPW